MTLGCQTHYLSRIAEQFESPQALKTPDKRDYVFADRPDENCRHIQLVTRLHDDCAITIRNTIGPIRMAKAPREYSNQSS